VVVLVEVVVEGVEAAVAEVVDSVGVAAATVCRLDAPLKYVA
jgi:hypothetical protein